MAQPLTPRQLNFFVFCFVLFFIGLILVALTWKGNGFYIRPYQAVNTQMQHQKDRRDVRQSNQPTAPGFSESDIRKSKGNRYNTY